MATRSDQPIQTLRLNDRDKAKLLWAIDQASGHNSANNPRALRVSCMNTEAVLILKSDVGTETPLAVLARNLSRWGASLVHGRYVHPNTRCEVEIQAQNGMPHEIPGTVQHIRHVQGTIHELDVVFDEPIDLTDFVSLSPTEETRYLRELADEMPESTESDVDQLANRVLVVDDFSCDRKLFSHWLSEAGLAVDTCVDIRSAHVQIQEQVFDLVVVDQYLDEENGAQLIRELREAKFTAPIISVSADGAEALIAEVTDAGANGFLKKPFTKDILTSKAFELLGVDGNNDLSPIFSTLKDDTEMRPLLTEFTRKVSAYIEELREANSQANYDAINSLSRQLRGAGEGYGFPMISEIASDLFESINQDTAEVDQIRKTTTELIAILNRVKLS